MIDVVLGVLAVIIGLLLCFRGRGAMRVLLAIWGAFAGFGLGGVLIAALTDEGYLVSALGWIAAIVLAVVFAALAYLFFAVAIVLAFTSMGFILGATLASALGASNPWVLTGVGVLCGLALGALAIATNLPDLVLIVISAFAGASVAVTGLMLVLDVVDTEALLAVDAPVTDRSLWFVGQVVLAVVGIIVQVRRGRRRRAGTMRQTWSQSAPA